MLSSITAAALDQLFQIRFPWIRDRQPDLQTTSGSPSDAQLRRIAWPLLESLSSLGPSPDNVPDLTLLLPVPSDPTFPLRAVALVFLLDQCPRYYCMQGTNARWLSGFFDPLAQRLLEQLFDLPEELRLLRHERWPGIGYPHFLVITSLLFTAADHSESLNRHQMLHHLGEDRRREMFQRTHIPDPFTDTLRRDIRDPLAFSRWMRAGLPPVADAIEWMYLRLVIVDFHLPIVQQFGRYPYRNSTLGRASTPEEVHFLQASGHFGEVDASAAARIRQDIAAGRWSPLEDVSMVEG